MNELINFNFEDVDGIQTVNARDLHAALGVQSKFADWIKNRIEKYDFFDFIDYTLVSKILETSLGGGKIQKEYFISLSMAKELCMVENNE